MAKRLRTRDHLLLGLAMATDFLVPAVFRAARGLPPEEFYLWSRPRYKKRAFTMMVKRLLKTGSIEKVIKNGKPYFSLADKNLQYKREFSLFSMRHKGWDRRWRLVIFDIPEEKKSIRNNLRQKLYELGFGRLQRSIYISPYDLATDLAEFLKSQKLLGLAFVLTAKHELMGDPKDLANLVWNLDKLNKKYEKLLSKIKLTELMEIGLRKTREKIRELRTDFLEILAEDPILPIELLPENWVGEVVKSKLTGNI